MRSSPASSWRSGSIAPRSSRSGSRRARPGRIAACCSAIRSAGRSTVGSSCARGFGRCLRAPAFRRRRGSTISATATLRSRSLKGCIRRSYRRRWALHDRGHAGPLLSCRAEPPARRSADNWRRALRMRLIARLAFGAVVILAPIASGFVGYNFGVTSRPAASPQPTWTDRESSLSSDFVRTLRCTYHLADGTTRKTDRAVLATGSEARIPDTRTCPPSP